MTRFNIDMPKEEAFPKNLDMEDAYGLLSEKTDLYYRYVNARDMEKASQMHDLCNEVAQFYNLLFVTEKDIIQEFKKIKHHQHTQRVLLVKKIDDYLQAKEQARIAMLQAQYAKQYCEEIAMLHNLEFDINNLSAWHEHHQREIANYNTENIVPPFTNFEDYENDKEQNKILMDWFSSGCSSYEDYDFDDHKAQISVTNDYDGDFYESSFTCPDHH